MEIKMESCNVCLNKFKDYELQNPRWCCSVRLCKDCYGKTDSCPQCRNNDNHENIDLSGIVKIEGERIIFTRKMEKYRERSTCHKDGTALWTEYLENDSERFYNMGNEPNLIKYMYAIKIHSWVNSDGIPHREDGPADIFLNGRGHVTKEIYMIDGAYQQRDMLPNEISYKRRLNGDVEEYSHHWRDSDGNPLEREGDEPSSIRFRPDGTIIQENYGHNREFGIGDPEHRIEFAYYPDGKPKYKCWVGMRIHYDEDGNERHSEEITAGNCIKHVFYKQDGSVLFQYKMVGHDLQYME